MNNYSFLQKSLILYSGYALGRSLVYSSITALVDNHYVLKSAFDTQYCKDIIPTAFEGMCLTIDYFVTSFHPVVIYLDGRNLLYLVSRNLTQNYCKGFLGLGLLGGSFALGYTYRDYLYSQYHLYSQYQELKNKKQTQTQQTTPVSSPYEHIDESTVET